MSISDKQEKWLEKTHTTQAHTHTQHTVGGASRNQCSAISWTGKHLHTYISFVYLFGLWWVFFRAVSLLGDIFSPLFLLVFHLFSYASLYSFFYCTRKVIKIRSRYYKPQITHTRRGFFYLPFVRSRLVAGNLTAHLFSAFSARSRTVCFHVRFNLQ